MPSSSSPMSRQFRQTTRGRDIRLYIPRLSDISGSDPAISQAEHLNGVRPFIRRMLPPILLSIHGMGGLAKWRRETLLGQVDNQAACIARAAR